jgi:hypothetical protein
MIARTISLLLAPALLFAVPALAQDKTYRNAAAISGRPLRLAVFENVSPDCKPGPLPEINVTTPPKNGTLAVRSGKVKAGSLSRCPTLEVPRNGVFYQSKPGFKGADEVAFEVKRPDGRTHLVTYRIEVSEQPKRGTKPETTDL